MVPKFFMRKTYSNSIHNYLKAVLLFLISPQLLEYLSLKKMQLIVTLIVVVIFAIFTSSSAQYMSGNNGWETVATNDRGVIDAAKFAVDWYVQGGDAQFLVVDATKQVRIFLFYCHHSDDL